MGGPPSTLAHVRLSLRPRGSPEASRTLLHPHLCICPALRPGPGLPELPLSYTSWSPLGGVAQNGAPRAPTLRTASPALIHAHPHVVQGSSTPTPGHSPHAYCLAKSLFCPQVPSGSQGPRGGPPFILMATGGCTEDLRLPGWGETFLPRPYSCRGYKQDLHPGPLAPGNVSQGACLGVTDGTPGLRSCPLHALPTLPSPLFLHLRPHFFQPLRRRR